MFRRLAVTSALAATLALPLASYAAPHSGEKNVHIVHMTLRNKSAQPMDLLCGDKPITIAANSDYKLDAPEGTVVYGAADHSTKLQVTRDLNGTVASFR